MPQACIFALALTHSITAGIVVSRCMRCSILGYVINMMLYSCASALSSYILRVYAASQSQLSMSSIIHDSRRQGPGVENTVTSKIHDMSMENKRPADMPQAQQQDSAAKKPTPMDGHMHKDSRGEHVNNVSRQSRVNQPEALRALRDAVADARSVEPYVSRFARSCKVRMMGI